MATETNRELQELMVAASSASGADRINLRDPIAEYGSQAILALEPWLADPRLAAFAVRTIGQEAASDEALAVEVLRRNLPKVCSAITRSDIRTALSKLGVKPVAAANRRSVRELTASYDPVELDGLVIGDHYEQAHLHASGLGGNPQSGISYPAGGDYGLLFSNPARENETGYHDRWTGPDEILFFGRWDGDGDMQLDGVNRKFIELSPELHLFVVDAGSYRYEGRFEYVAHDEERTVRDGTPTTAIVFQLRRVR
jgi:hypothetical protein